ncbi:MAG: hypothetical protein Q8P26_01495 [Candidatus Levybacteria bacterium]|nr:hypothetical protein [Candidatus Levybacteria bacterium]
MLRLAKTISFLFGPIFILFPIPFILVGKFTQDYSYALKWTIFSYAFVLAVAVFVMIGVLFKFFTNFDVSKREQRPLLFAFSGFAMFCYFISLLFFNGPKILFIALFAIVLGLIIIMIVNRWVKASIHLATFASVTLFVGIIYGGYYFLPILLTPLLAWARVKAKEHTVQETIVGSILGAVITLVVYAVSRQFLMEIVYN